LLINSSGNVGIGTSSPGARLDVVGVGRFFSNSAGSFNYMDVGRTAGEARVAVAGATNDFLTGTVAGDALFYAPSTGKAWYGTASATAAIFATNNTERARIDSAGNLGIGTSSPSTRLHVVGSGNPTITLAGSDGAYSSIFSMAAAGGGSSVINANGGQNTLLLQTNSTTKAVLDSSGNLGIGTSSPSYKLDVVGNGYFSTGMSVADTSAVNWGAWTSIQENGFFDAGGNFLHNAVKTSGANDTWNYRNNGFATRYKQLNAVHSWYTAPSGTAGDAISFSQAMTLDASGNLLVGKTSGYRSGKLVVAAANVSQGSTLANLHVTTTDTQGADLGGSIGMGGQVGGDETPFGVISGRKENGTSGNYAGYLAFATQNSGATIAERARITSSGNLLVGTTSAYPNGSGLTMGTTGYWASHATGTASGTQYVGFDYDGVTIGSITQSGTSAVLYNVTSDQRLKENIVDAPEFGSVIDALQVRSFDWKTDQTHQRAGFIAQELVTVAPEAVHQPTDPEEMMAVDYSKLVPMLVKEIQSLRARLAAANI
jgi:hypothetical protein